MTNVIDSIRGIFRRKKGIYKDINEMFHHRYYKRMFNKYVMIVLRNGDIMKGNFSAELPEVDSIKIGSRIVKIEDIDLIKLIEDYVL